MARAERPNLRAAWTSSSAARSPCSPRLGYREAPEGRPKVQVTSSSRPFQELGMEARERHLRWTSGRAGGDAARLPTSLRRSLPVVPTQSPALAGTEAGSAPGGHS